ncbi:uncharacterized protein LOC142511512 [Primulina tabacum]|uniref:uncharacterized protein LOC142511512 n=1 Tax=Primulina tabacum TaxID=48773 RepID=UPI003F5AC0A5
MYICGRGKEELLTGSSSQPETTDPNYKTWKAENNQVMAWLINSMIPEIGENLLLYPSASEIWEAARESFSCCDNTAELFAIESAVHDLRQEDSTVTEYFSSLTRNWQTIDLTETHDWKCSKDEKVFRSVIENKRVFKFLMGLNNNFDDVRGRILSTNPLSNLRAAFSVVRQEESRRKVMLGSSPQSSDNSALVVQRQNSFPTSNVTAPQGLHQGQPSSNTKGKMIPRRPWCEYCKKPTHNIESCWKIHGKPPDWKPARDRRAHSVVSEPTPPIAAPFTKEQLEALHKLFSQHVMPSSVIGTGSTAIPGDIPLTLISQTNLSSYWIVDSGASDHMCSQLQMFTSYSPSRVSKSVRVADGSCTKVLGSGSIWLSPELCLHNVLFVPALHCNLLSVSAFNKNLHCSTIFSTDSCVFQDLESGRTIGNAKCCAGLYLFTMKPPVESSSNAPDHHTSAVQSIRNNEFLLWHYRLGHPNFLYLKKLFPSLVNNKTSHSPYCDVCQFSKHTRTSFTPHTYTPSKPFSLIHSDIWGPSRIKKTLRVLGGFYCLLTIILVCHGFFS